MDIPTFLTGSDQQNQNFFELLTQTLRAGLSDNGWTVPPITDARLTIIAPLMPDGTLWYVSDAVPPTPVMKVNGALVKFTTTAYP